MSQKPKNRKLFLRPYGAVILLVGGLIIIIATLGLTNTTHLFRSVPKTPENPVTNTNLAKGETSSSSNTAATTVSGNADQKNQGDNEAVLVVPSGNFISSHHTSLNSGDHFNSSCTTSVGAMCKIIFKQEGMSKSLPAQLTDNNGSAYWNNWTLGQYGITAGTWQVSAEVTLGSQTKTAADAQPLEVTP